MTKTDESPFLKLIGTITTPYLRKEDCPRQGFLSEEICTVEVSPQYKEGLRDVETCTHLILLYWFHQSERNSLIAMPPQEKKGHGVFATRSPNRPNPIGMSVVELLGREGNALRVRGLDCLTGTGLIDIKPYSVKPDCRPEAKIGWSDNL